MIEIIKRYFNKYFFLAVGIIFFIFLCGFFLLKDQYYYEVIDRLYNFPLEFAHQYYQDDISKLVLGNYFMAYKAPYLVDIFSSTYLYFITFSTSFFQALFFLIPILIFALIHRIIGSDFYDRFYQIAVYRVGKAKYLLGHFLGVDYLEAFFVRFLKYYIILLYAASL